MPRGFCRYCEEPFTGDYSVGIPAHTELECRDVIDANLRAAVTSMDFPDLSDAVLRNSLNRVLTWRRTA